MLINVFKLFSAGKNKKISNQFIALCCFSLLIAGCLPKSCTSTKDIPPEEQLHAYVKLAVNIVRPQQKQELIDLTTGPLRTALLSASEESFKKAYIDRKYDFHSFDIMQRIDTKPGKEIIIDYKLSYKSWLPGEDPERVPEQVTENRATFIYEYGRWALANVESLRSELEWSVGLPLTNVNTSDPGALDVKDVTSSREIEE